MENVMIRNTAGAMISFPENGVREFVNALETAGITVEVFKAGEVPFDKLPDEVRAETLDILKAYDHAHVEFVNGSFKASASCCLLNTYSADHCTCGTYYAKELYTREQRRQNFAEVFGYAPRVW